MTDVNEAVKVLHVITGLTIGGAEMALYRLLAGGDRRRFPSTVISLGDRGVLADRLEALEVEVLALGMPSGRPTLRGLRGLLSAVNRIRPDVISGWMYHGNLAASTAKRLGRTKPKLIWNVRHSVYDLRAEKRSTAMAIRLGRRFSNAERIVYNSQLSAGQHERLGYPSACRCVVPNGFDCELFRPRPDARIDVRRELGLPTDAILIGLVARFHPMKDHANFLQAAARLTETRPDAQFILVGAGVDRPNLERVASAEMARLAGRVHLLGRRDDVARLTAAFDLATCASWSEAFPNVVGEAMACEVPGVVTDVGDVRELLGETGVVVPIRDPEALARGWARLLDGGNDERRRLGDLARRWIVERFSLGRVVKAYEGLYAELMRQPGVRVD
jgi:glycosyltransferase involved in cell wall biosynthesis